MSVEDDLAEWIATRPAWQQSVIARLCKQESFDDAAIAADENGIRPAEFSNAGRHLRDLLVGHVAEGHAALEQFALESVPAPAGRPPKPTTGVVRARGHGLRLAYLRRRLSMER